jgi:tRNA/tmRNA/rRNA uracil-C5-methylase (TrmA/RlmC/RlmD family)
LYTAEVAVKQRQLEDFLSRIPCARGMPVAYLPPVASPLELHYRNKITLHAARDPRGRTLLGYRADGNRSVLDIPACPLARAPMNAALARFRASPSFSRLEEGASVTFRWTEADGAVHWIGVPAAHAPGLTETTGIGALRVPRGGFFQVNPEVADMLVRQVADWFAINRHATPDLMDLYCGVGVFGLACAQRGARRVLGIESGRDAVRCARENARALNLSAEFRCQSGRQAASTAFGGYDLAHAVVILDPPRSGLEKETCLALARLKPPRLLVVSCDPATLARDLAILIPAGYRITAARLFDLFPRTAHFESAVVLESSSAGLSAS